MPKSTKKWRSQIDTSDVEAAQRDRGRASMSAMPDSELFFIDVETGKAARRKALREKPLRSQRGLLPNPAVY